MYLKNVGMLMTALFVAVYINRDPVNRRMTKHTTVATCGRARSDENEPVSQHPLKGWTLGCHQRGRDKENHGKYVQWSISLPLVNKITMFARKLMEPGVVLSKMSQIQKNT